MSRAGERRVFRFTRFGPGRRAERLRLAQSGSQRLTETHSVALNYKMSAIDLLCRAKGGGVSRVKRHLVVALFGALCHTVSPQVSPQAQGSHGVYAAGWGWPTPKNDAQTGFQTASTPGAYNALYQPPYQGPNPTYTRPMYNSGQQYAASQPYPITQPYTTTSYPATQLSPATQPHPGSQLYPATQQYPATQLSPATNPYPANQLYPATQPYPTLQPYPASQLYPATQPYQHGPQQPGQPDPALQTYGPGHLFVTTPPQTRNATSEQPGLGVALADLLRAKGAFLRSAVVGSLRAVLSVPRFLLDALRPTPSSDTTPPSPGTPDRPWPRIPT